MAAGVPLRTLGVVVRFTMSKDAAEKVKTRFVDMARRGESPNYLDCVMFDAALEKLGVEREYYGLDPDEWDLMLAERETSESVFGSVKTVDVTDAWREL
jgi:hypothetical protein